MDNFQRSLFSTNNIKKSKTIHTDVSHNTIGKIQKQASFKLIPFVKELFSILKSSPIQKEKFPKDKRQKLLEE